MVKVMTLEAHRLSSIPRQQDGLTPYDPRCSSQPKTVALFSATATAYLAMVCALIYEHAMVGFRGMLYGWVSKHHACSLEAC